MSETTHKDDVRYDNIDEVVDELTVPTQLEIKIQDIIIRNQYSMNAWNTDMIDRDGKHVSKVFTHKYPITSEIKTRDDGIIRVLAKNTGLDEGKARELFNDAVVDLINEPSTQRYFDYVNNESVNSNVNKHSTMELAREFVEKAHVLYDGDEKQHHIWKDNRYIETNKDDIMSIAIDVLKDEGLIETGRYDEFYRAMKVIAIRKFKKMRHPDKNLIQFKNVVYNIETKEEFEATPDSFYTRPIPHNLSKSDKCEYIDKLLNDWLPLQKEILYEIIAYSMYDDYPIHRMFWLLGTGRNGKGKFLELCMLLLDGVRNDVCVWKGGFVSRRTTTTDVKRLTEIRFESGKLYGKSMCLISEVNENIIKDTTFFKRYTGQDLISGEIKNGKMFEFKNFAKVIIAANKLPESTDKTKAWYDRNVILQFDNEFNEGNDIIGVITEEELENLCRRCVNSLHNVLKNKSFTGEGTSEEKMEKYEHNSFPVSRFIEDNFTHSKEEYMPMELFRHEFKMHVEKYHVTPPNDKQITQALKAMGHKVETHHISQDDIDRFGLIEIDIDIKPKGMKCVFGLLMDGIEPKYQQEKFNQYIHPDGQVPENIKIMRDISVSGLKC